MDNIEKLANERNKATIELRKVIDQWETENRKLGTNEFDKKAHGELKEKASRIEEDIDNISDQIKMAQRKASIDKPEFDVKAFSNQNQIQTRAGKFQPDEYAQRWVQAVSQGNIVEFRALGTGSSNAPVPFDMEKRIVEKLRQDNVMYRICRVNRIDGDKKLPIENALPTSYWVDEDSSVTDSAPSFSTQIEIKPYKAVCRVILTQEFIEDAIGNGGVGSGMNYVADKMAVSLGRKLEEAFVIGGGTTEPLGIATVGRIPTAVNLGSDAALTTLTADNVLDCYFGVGPQYRQSARAGWLMSDTALKIIRKLKASGSNEYLFKMAETGDLREAPLGILLGAPIHVSPFMPSVGTTTNGNDPLIIYGDFNYAEIFDRTGMTSFIDPYTNASTMKTNLYVYARTDFAITQSEAFAAITD